MNEGVLFRSPEFKPDGMEEAEATYRMAILAGHLTKDPEVSFIKTKQGYEIRKVLLNIKYYSKSYMNVIVWGDGQVAQAADCLEKGDDLLCAGMIRRTSYIPKRGANKGRKVEITEMNCMWLHAMSWTVGLLTLLKSPNIAKLIASDESDVMESMNDHLGDEYGDENAEYVGEDEYQDDYEVTI